MLELEDNEESFAASESRFGKTSDQQLSHEESALLELERCEIIGELLKLNPTYKAPADYKPLLKEAKVPIPVSGIVDTFTRIIAFPMVHFSLLSVGRLAITRFWRKACLVILY
ncbi:hypothetical protein ACS0TY_025150 [Phlomoides rotata]